MACIRENCKICADSASIRQFKEQLLNEEMKHTFDDFMDRMIGAEEDANVESVYAQGYQDLLVWYMALEEAYTLESLYSATPKTVDDLSEWQIWLEGMTFMSDWREDIRDNLWSAMNAHVWGPK